jgi:hypothetical protein
MKITRNVCPKCTYDANEFDATKCEICQHPLDNRVLVFRQLKNRKQNIQLINNSSFSSQLTRKKLARKKYSWLNLKPKITKLIWWTGLTVLILATSWWGKYFLANYQSNFGDVPSNNQKK